MSKDVKTITRWRIADAQFITTDPEVDTMSLTVEGAGKTYAIAIAGPKSMRSNDFIPALQAACASLLVAVGVSPTLVGCVEPGSDDDTFNTGEQRAN